MKSHSIEITRWVFLAALFSVPLLALGNTPLLKGVLGVHVPASALMLVVPAFVTILEARRLTEPGFLRTMLRVSKSDLVIFPVTVAVPFVITALDQRLQGNAFPVGQQVTLVGISALAFIVAAFLEEIGWNSWLMRGLVGSVGVFTASVVVGGLWAIWHLIPWFRLGHSIDWVLGQSMNTVATRWLIGELSIVRNRWLWPAVAAHASGNLAWSLTDNEGASFRPYVLAIGFALVAALFALRRRL